MNRQDILNIKLNYFELAYIMNIEVEESKYIFDKYSGRKIIAEYTTCKVSDLIPAFDVVKSVDKRYDNESSLVFNLMHRSNDYKKYLSDDQFIISGRFNGGKTVLLKIMSKEQLKHLYGTRKTKYSELINANKFNKLIIS